VKTNRPMTHRYFVKSAVETGVDPLLQDGSGRNLFTDPVAAGVKAA
jgi:hypothetical protein